ncbi:hypothetical protein BIW11_11076 [Tropilaelaps mercedesae]|uniref:Uncharacterized protein n=1 Tax=Tropilaelaps mercedesae TaxID=418985 RepID=A0A1V9XDA1_9ACAR|nr:hypothetical protein BIW11_11076 [Tropilaelaps mercedesae]
MGAEADDASNRARLPQQLHEQLQQLQQHKQMALQNQLQLASRSFNKRKNFQPKNIHQDEVALTTTTAASTDAPLDLSGPEPSKRSQTPPESPILGQPGPVAPHSASSAVATNTTHIMLKELLSLYGLSEVAESFLKQSVHNHNTSSAFAPDNGSA